MKRRIGSLFAVLTTIGCVLASSLPAQASTGRLSPTLSTTHRLDDRRFVVAGTRSYEVGTEAGHYPAMGFHTAGEMGGIWSAPLKLLDGIWFNIDGRWLPKATKFTSGWGYTKMSFPPVDGVTVGRTDFAPDGKRAVVFGLRLASADSRTVTVKVDAHSELMSAYPWGTTTPSQTDFNLADTAGYAGTHLVFEEKGRPPVPNAARHDWAAAVGGRTTPSGHATGRNFRGPQDPASICPTSGDQPYRCDDTTYGRGAGGQLTYNVHLKAGRARMLWFAVAGSQSGTAQATRTLHDVLAAPGAELRSKVDDRKQLATWSRVHLPGDPLLAEGLRWSQQNLADLTQTAKNLHLRETDTGTRYPPSEGRLRRITFFGAGYPDYPWLFATDGEYASFAALAAGQFHTIEQHMLALERVSKVINHNSGKVVHETVTDGSVYFGTNADPGDTDETVKFPSAVAQIWRWTGDKSFLDRTYPFVRKGMHYVFSHLDQDHDLWPEGAGNVEVEGMGQEKLDVSVYAIRGLLDLAEMARAESDVTTARWATHKANVMRRRFEKTWYKPRIPQHADSLVDPGNHQQYKRYWTGVTPMEAELWLHGRSFPGATPRSHGVPALALRQTHCYSSDFGMYFQGIQGCDPSTTDTSGGQIIFTVNTAVMAVGEGNYGRLAAGQQQRYTTANRRLQLPNPDEQPGAMPEIAPSKDYGRSIDLPFNSRAQVMQGWGNYGTLWPVIHQQLGVSPDLGRGRFSVVPQVPPYEHRITGRRIRLGSGYANVVAFHQGTTYKTDVHNAAGADLTIGATVDRGQRATSVRLEGLPVPYQTTRTNRGKEVTVQVGPTPDAHLVVHTRT